MFDHKTEPEPHGIITRPMDTAIKRFQKNNDLRADGYIYPKGETEEALATRSLFFANRLSENEESDTPPIPKPKPPPPSQESEVEKPPKNPDRHPRHADCMELWNARWSLSDEIKVLAAEFGNLEAELNRQRQRLQSLKVELNERQVDAIPFSGLVKKGRLGGLGVALDLVDTGGKFKGIHNVRDKIKTLKNKIAAMEARRNRLNKEQDKKQKTFEDVHIQLEALRCNPWL